MAPQLILADPALKEIFCASLSVPSIVFVEMFPVSPEPVLKTAEAVNVIGEPKVRSAFEVVTLPPSETLPVRSIFVSVNVPPEEIEWPVLTVKMPLWAKEMAPAAVIFPANVMADPVREMPPAVLVTFAPKLANPDEESISINPTAVTEPAAVRLMALSIFKLPSGLIKPTVSLK